MVQAERQGEILVAGENITSKPLQKLIPQLSIALYNPSWELFFTTAEEELLFALENLGLPETEIEERIRTVTAQLGLESMLSKTSLHLSQGWQKLLILAVHMAIRPQVLLLDEPFVGLSETSLKRAINCLTLYLEAGGSLVLAEQSPSAAELKPIVQKLNVDKQP